MQHGGKRAGAGRKTGSASKKTRDIADKAAAAGITPLEVMLKAMREAEERGDTEKAVEHAVHAAPYLHPRLSAVQAKVEHQKSYVARIPAPAASTEEWLRQVGRAH